jgi:FMN phosphatase YigB (HAD superfamily)
MEFTAERFVPQPHAPTTSCVNVAGLQQSVETLSGQLTDRDEMIQTLTARLAESEQMIQGLSTQLAEMSNSKAWAAALWLRKTLVLIAPPGSRRNRALRRLAKACLLAGTKIRRIGNANAWTGQAARLTLSKIQPLQGAKSPNLVNIENVVPCPASPGRIAVHVHIFYPDLAAEFAGCLLNMPFPYDLFVSAPDQEAYDACARVFSGLPLCEKLRIEIVPNRGRDMAPMFCAFGKELMNYSVIGHLHSKKSRYNKGATLGWREYLCTNLFGSNRRIRQIFALLSGENPAGIVYPQTYSNMPSWAHTWLANRQMGVKWCKRLGIDRVPRGYFDYPVGSMFWARAAALRPLFAAGISWEDFPVEAGQSDGTLAHCLERLFVLVARQQGFHDAVIEDAKARNWSAWRLDRYFSRTPKAAEACFGDPKLRVIAFDVFDTLLSRPLLDPEATKEIVAQRAAKSLGGPYREYRVRAEAVARQQAGRDVGLDGIYAEFAKQSGLTQQESDSLRTLEEEVEWHSVSPRADGVSLLEAARRTGKRVILVSDMFLPKDFFEALLKEHGIVAWDALYLSSDVGLRKDTGELYRHILDREGVLPGQMLMVGDNERVDVQIPVDMRMPTYHVLRPTEIARALPRLNPFVEELERDKDLSNQLTMGLLVRRAYSPVFYQGLNPVSLFPSTPFALGYSVVGPLLLGFAHWLSEQARRDGMDRLYFLAREGQKLKLVYDRWAEALGAGPPSEYLVLSRRATTVPAINSHQDILNIARTLYTANAAKCFLAERFGLVLPEKRWDELHRQIGWGPRRQVAVPDGQIDKELQKLLRAVQDDILAQAAAERPALQAYLREMGFENAARAAIVDIGYSATVQDRISLFMNKPIHGYYMTSDAQARAVADRHRSIVRGCFVEGAKSRQTAPATYRNSFTLEKLLGCNDAQIVRYTLQEDGRVSGVYKPLSRAERQGNQARADIEKGMLEYTADAIKLRKNLFPAFSPPLRLPEEIFAAFTVNLSRSEHDMLQTLILDDFYCGQGLV